MNGRSRARNGSSARVDPIARRHPRARTRSINATPNFGCMTRRGCPGDPNQHDFQLAVFRRFPRPISAGLGADGTSVGTIRYSRRHQGSRANRLVRQLGQKPVAALTPRMSGDQLHDPDHGGSRRVDWAHRALDRLDLRIDRGCVGGEPRFPGRRQSGSNVDTDRRTADVGKAGTHSARDAEGGTRAARDWRRRDDQRDATRNGLSDPCDPATDDHPGAHADTSAGALGPFKRRQRGHCSLSVPPGTERGARGYSAAICWGSAAAFAFRSASFAWAAARRPSNFSSRRCGFGCTTLSA
jgi:hypothetical protein